MAMARCSRTVAVVLPSIVVATIYEGTYYLKNSDGVLPFTKITGPLCILAEYSGDVGTNLPHLEEVDSLCVDAASQVEISIFLPELVKICHCLGVRANEQIQEIRLPKLTSAGEFNMQISTKLETLFVPELKEVGNVYITQTKLKQLAFPVLEQVSGKCHISANDQFEELHLPQLKTVGRLNISSNELLEELHLPNLKTIGRGLEVRGNDEFTQLELPALAQVGKRLNISSNELLEELHLPNLKTVGNSLLVHRNSELTRVNLPKLEKVGLRIKMCRNDQLQLLYLPELKTLKPARGSGMIESSILHSKLIVVPKVPASEVHTFCAELSKSKNISYDDLKMKFEGLSIYQQVRSATNFATVLGMKWFANFHTSQGKRLDVSTIFPKQRRQGRRLNLLTFDKSVLRNVLLMLQPAMWHERTVEIFSLVENHKHILD